MVLAWEATGSRVLVLREGTRMEAASVQTGVADLTTTGSNAMATHSVQ